MIKIQIQSISGSLLFEHESENNTTKETVEKAIADRADLRYANLQHADLRSANLQNADLRYADLQNADLQNADLRYADLLYANLRYANLQNVDLQHADLRSADLQSANLQNADLRYANLQSADLRSANLQYANLQHANLWHANLQHANLQHADLRYANLQHADLLYADLRSAENWQHTEWANQAKQNILFILSYLKSEVPWLRQALIDGKINGTKYEWECCCLIGTIGKKEGVDEVCNTIPFYKKWLHNLAEQFFYQIKEGDTPKNSEFSRVAVELCDMVLNS